ncbi:MAG: MarR family transcriptional regulator [Anaerolineales bacterium]|nr:MarR family transcriptional regulator [Anaerolineales bacterium]
MAASDQFLAAMHKFAGLFMRNSMRNFLHFAKENGVSLPQIGALFRIRKGDCSVSDISAELRITNAAASQMLESLVRQEFIRRSEDPDDRRAKQIVLTEKGRKILLDSMQARQGWMQHLAHALTPQEQAQITSALTLLAEKTAALEKEHKLHA